VKPIPLTCILLGIFFISACNKDKPSPQSPTPSAPVDTVKLRLVNYAYISGNLQAGDLDTFVLRFSKSVKLNSLVFLRNYCSPDLQHTLTNGDSVIRFYNFKCGGLGGDYPFEYSVSDSSGNKLTDSLTFHCYYYRATTAGLIQNYFVSQDGRYCWIITNSPNQIIRMSLADTASRQTYNLDFTPFNAGYNYYNNLLYIMAAGFPQRDTVFVMDPNNGQIVKRIHLPEDTSGVLEDYAYSAEFGSNGYGMLGITNDGGTTRWLVIDSKNNDSIYTHPYFSTVFISGMRDLASTSANFDGSQIIGLESGGSGRLAVLDCNTHNLSEVSFPFSPSIYSSYMVASKAANEVFVVNLQPTGENQFLTQNYSMVGVFTGFDAYNASSADFSYRPGENFYVYYFDGNIAGVVDYSTGNILKYTDVNTTLSRITSTPDGKYIVFMGSNNMTLIDGGALYP
jgi:hypothetical protein